MGTQPPSRGKVKGNFDQSALFRITCPPFITNRTWSRLEMSCSGLPSTAIMSANLPTSMLPRRSCQPRSRAALMVAARMTSIGGMPASA
jgi:hypothetical protein